MTETNDVGIIICAHGSIADSLRSAATDIMGDQAHFAAVSIDGTDVDSQLAAAISDVDGGQGVLIMADLFGGSAANLALSYLGDDVEVVTGVNLPMLLAALSSRRVPIAELAQKIAQRARQSVVVAGELLVPQAA